MPPIIVTIPIRLVNPLNGSHLHWRTTAKRGKREKAATTLMLARYRGKFPPAPWVVTITRISAGEMDSDGNTASMKYVRDAVAKCLGVDDKDSPMLEWRTRQRKGPIKYYAVEVKVEAKEV